MINFSNTPPDDDRAIGLDLLRTPTATPIVAALTCEKLIGCPTHFWGGRTIPHDATDCEPCNNGSPRRWHGYVSAFDHRNGLHFLFETTLRASKVFAEWSDKYGSLRGAKFEARRPQKRPNGRVDIRLKSIDLIEFPLPKEPNIIAILAVLWNIPIADLFDAVPTERQTQIGADRGITELAKQWAQRKRHDPNAPPPAKSNGELLTIGEAEEITATLEKVIGGNGNSGRSPIAGVPD